MNLLGRFRFRIRGGRRRGRLGLVLAGRRFLGGSFLKVLEEGESAEVHAVGAFDAALHAAEGFECVLEGVTEGGIVLDGLVDEVCVAEVFVEAFDL